MNADQLIAHRGWQRRYPENTLLAIEGAINAGALHIEIDVQLSRDGVPVLLHNRDLSHMTGQRVCAHEITWEAMQKLSAPEAARFGDAFSHNTLCSLDNVVALIEKHPHVHLYVEIKRVAVENASEKHVVDAILESIKPIAEQCTLISFWIPALLYAKTCEFPRLGPVLIDWPQIYSAEISTLSPSVIFCDSEKIPTDANLKEIPFPLAVYEVDTVENAEYWFARDVRWIETFAIGELLQYKG